MVSAYFENEGAGHFKTYPLPNRLQFSPLLAAELVDLDKDGHKEVVLGGNFYDTNIEMGRYDADYGNVLTIGQYGKMTVFPLKDMPIKGQIRHIKSIGTKRGELLIFGRNDEGVEVLGLEEQVVK